MPEIVGQGTLEITVPTVSKRKKERPTKKEFPNDRRLIVKGSSVYLDPDAVGLPIGKVSKPGHVQDLGKIGFLNQFRPVNQITLETSDGIPVVLIQENTAFTHPNRLVKLK